MKNVDAILCADLHLREKTPVCRTDNYFEAQSRKIKFLRDLQLKYKVPIINAGDLFDKKVVSSYLEGWAINNLPDDFFSIPGNHDTGSESEFTKTSYYVLESAGKLKTISQLNKLFPHHKIKVLHQAIHYGDNSFPGSTSAKSIIRKYKDYDLIVSGDNHFTFTVKRHGVLLVNVGSMMRTDADQIDHKPCVFLWDSSCNEVEPVYFPIEKDVISREHIESKQAKDERIESFVNMLSDGSNDYNVGIDFKDNCIVYMDENNIESDVRNKVLEVLN